MMQITPILTSLLAAAPNQSTHPTHSNLSDDSMIITKLARYAVKGLPGDILPSVTLTADDKTFPDDRRFALFKQKQQKIASVSESASSNDSDDDIVKFNDEAPKWLHKENFLCAFSAPEFMAEFQSSYEIVTQEDNEKNSKIQRLLTLRRRQDTDEMNYEHALGPVDLNQQSGREELAAYFSREQPPSFPSSEPEKMSKTPLVCITQSTSEHHTHQFGNTSSGVKKNNGDTRTVHLVNEATVRDVESKIGIKLNAMRFRPNIVVDGLEAWKEFDFVGKRLKIIRNQDERDNDNDIVLKVLSKTVRCAGIGIDPMDPMKKVDMPQLLSKNFPQYGPYLGIYAVIECSANNGSNDEFRISPGDRIELID